MLNLKGVFMPETIIKLDGVISPYIDLDYKKLFELDMEVDEPV